MLFTRPDGVRVRGESTSRKILPFLMPHRMEAMVQLEQQFDITNALAYLERVNADRKERRISLFHVILCSIARTLHMRPKLNRFIVGQRLYQRHKLEFSFEVKKMLADDAIMTPIKVAFEPDDTLESVMDRISTAVARGRAGERTDSEEEIEFVASMPRFLVRLVVGILRRLDYFNLMPRKMIEADELYCSMFIANLGSLGLEAPFHHLYEWGTAPLFCGIGKACKTPVVDEHGRIVVRDMITIRWSFDERIADGYYCARSLDLIRSFISQPEMLERKPELAPPSAIEGRVANAS
jgi:hypothetical protein